MTTRMLILGGTRHLGRAPAENALAGGWQVTCFNRGHSGRNVLWDEDPDPREIATGGQAALPAAPAYGALKAGCELAVRRRLGEEDLVAAWLSRGSTRRTPL